MEDHHHPSLGRAALRQARPGRPNGLRRRRLVQRHPTGVPRRPATHRRGDDGAGPTPCAAALDGRLAGHPDKTARALPPGRPAGDMRCQPESPRRVRWKLPAWMRRSSRPALQQPVLIRRGITGSRAMPIQLLPQRCWLRSRGLRARCGQDAVASRVRRPRREACRRSGCPRWHVGDHEPCGGVAGAAVSLMARGRAPIPRASAPSRPRRRSAGDVGANAA